MLDSILLEQHGVPSVPIVTTVFQGSVRALAKAQGFADFPLVVIKHPVAYVGDAELEERAREVLRQAIPALLGGDSNREAIPAFFAGEPK